VTEGWTLDQLVGLVAEALATDGVHAPNGRVREVPDARSLRWYATIGLLDRPSTFRGRTALYGPRHLLQAVAVKRRQAEGMALAQIQVELSGATDATLHRVARVPERLLADAQPPASGGRGAGRRDVRAASADRLAAQTQSVLRAAEVRSPQAPFWRAAPASISAPRAGGGEPGHAEPGHAEPGHAEQDHAEQDHAEPRHLIRLGPGATLVLNVAPSAADVADLRAAAAPLIRVLADRALLTAEEPRHDDH